MNLTSHARKLSRLTALLLASLALSSPAWAVGYTATDLGNWSVTAINNTGQIVGNQGLRPVLWSSGIMTDLGTLGGTYGYAYDISNIGQIVGRGGTAGNNANHAFISNGSTMTDLGTLGGNDSGAFGVNDTGQVVGYSAIVSGATRATLWSGGIATNIGTLGGSYSMAIAINNTGQIVGSGTTATDENSHAILWNGGTMTDLGTLGGNYTFATAINNTGQIVGSSCSNGSGISSCTIQHAFSWSSGTMTDLGTLGGSHSGAKGMNDSGKIVGYSSTASGAYHATLWSGGTTTDLVSLIDPSILGAGWELWSAIDINDNGWIVGNATNSTGQTRAFLLTPNIATVPLPHTAWLLGSGLLGLISVARRKTA